MQSLLDERAAKAQCNGVPQSKSPARKSLLMILDDGFTGYIRDAISRACARQQHDVRSPLYARRLIEYALSIPERQRRRGNVNKHMHLRSLTGDLPPEVLDRRTKAMADAVFLRHVDAIKQVTVGADLQNDLNWLNVRELSQLESDRQSWQGSAVSMYGAWSAFGCLNLFAGR
jgi:asparagine synthetase B (glutamine-hydrolysing)